MVAIADCSEDLRMGVSGRQKSRGSFAWKTSASRRRITITKHIQGLALQNKWLFLNKSPIRPSLNIDINRNACTLGNPKDLLAFIDAMKKHPSFGWLPGMPCQWNTFGPPDFENRPSFSPLFFLFDEGRAEQQFHDRTVMMNWLFTPNMTYQELATKSVELWNLYLDYESVPGFGSKDPKTHPNRGEPGAYYYACAINPSVEHTSMVISRQKGFLWWCVEVCGTSNWRFLLLLLHTHKHSV